jgi:hypothetical protein
LGSAFFEILSFAYLKHCLLTGEREPVSPGAPSTWSSARTRAALSPKADARDVNTTTAESSMLEKIKTAERSKIEFTFPSGEHAGERYGVELGFCPNPVCRCGTVSIRAKPDQSTSEAFVPSFEFSVDVIKKELDTSRGNASKYNRNFGSAFVDHLKDEDWALLIALFYDYKRKITDEVSDEELDAQFPADEIEYSSAMIGFNEILPYAEDKTLHIGDRRFLLDEQYCVRPGCNCSDVAVSLLGLGEKHETSHLTDCPVIFLDYKTAGWRIERTASEDTELLNRIAKQLSTEEYTFLFESHHERLKSLYRLYKKRYDVNPTPVHADRKVGRNDPCPCGSGKKYKKCCLGSSIAP